MAKAKMHYHGSPQKCAPAGVITGVRMCSESTCDRVEVHLDGVRGGTYMISVTPDEGVSLIIKLEAEVRRLAGKKGYTCPSLTRLIEHRRGAST